MHATVWIIVSLLLAGCATENVPAASQSEQNLERLEDNAAVAQKSARETANQLLEWVIKIKPLIGPKTVCIGEFLWEGYQTDIGEELALDLAKVLEQEEMSVLAHTDLKNLLAARKWDQSRLMDRQADSPGLAHFQKAHMIIIGAVFSKSCCARVELELINLADAKHLAIGRIEYPYRTPKPWQAK